MSANLSRVLCVVVLFLSSCGYRKPTETRFKEVCAIKLPEGTTVLKNQYIEAGKEYGIRYNLQLTNEGIRQFAQAIRESKDYSPAQMATNEKWIQKGNGYSYYLAKDNIFHQVEVDTISRTIFYIEQG